MDEIFNKSTSVFDVVSVARDTPRPYGKNGELLVSYFDTEAAAAEHTRRRSSVTGPVGPSKSSVERTEKVGNSY